MIMKAQTWVIMTIVALLLGAVQTIQAVPAKRTPFEVVQPNGDTLTVRLVGDERWHAHYTADGYLIAQNKKGYYCYAKWGKEQADRNGVMRQYAKPTCKKAHDANKRKKCENRWLKRHKIPTREF